MGGRVVEGTGLENRRGLCPPGVRIPPHPLNKYTLSEGLTPSPCPKLLRGLRKTKGDPRAQNQGMPVSTIPEAQSDSIPNQAGQAGLDLSGPLKPTSIGGSDKGTGILG
jgi:hypothetical protein